jgi:hypothetical protein
MRHVFVLAMAAALAGCMESPAGPALAIDRSPVGSASVSNDAELTPFSAPVYVPCANDGAGETVDLIGALRISTHTTTDANGGVHVVAHVWPHQVAGMGRSSGARYRGTGGTFQAEHYAEDGFPVTYSLVNNFRIIGQGKGNNLLIHSVVHLTINANGDVTSSVDVSSADCR